jgi:deoxyribonuclease V
LHSIASALANEFAEAGEGLHQAIEAKEALRIEGEIVASWLRTRRNASPLAVHPAWRTTLDTAIAVVMVATARWRTPEPLRQARRAAREARDRPRSSQ